MRKNKLSIDWLRGVHVSGISNSGYGENFKACLFTFFFYEKISRAQKHSQMQNKQLLPP